MKTRRICLEEINNKIKNDTLLSFLPEEELINWRKRIQTVLLSDDNEKIICVRKAGSLKGKYLIMHNGLKIDPLSYYGFPMLNLLLKNKGIHEPQEEYVFQQVLNYMPNGATMIELGAYWSFYSMWFNKKVKKAKNYMIEPEDLCSGVTNFKLNKLNGSFSQYYISDRPGNNENGYKVTSVDAFIKQNNIDFVDILHSDIQGSELLMLKGAKNVLTKRKVGYIFISTHSDQLHINCAEYLKSLDYIEVSSVNLQESFSWDGLLVFKNPKYPGVEKVGTSLRTTLCL